MTETSWITKKSDKEEKTDLISKFISNELLSDESDDEYELDISPTSLADINNQYIKDFQNNYLYIFF